MKYIVTLTDKYTVGGKIGVPVTINGHTAWIGTGIKLEPYEEPDLEAIKKEAYDQCEDEREKIKVGDEVNCKGDKGIITRVSDDGGHFNVMWANGSTGYCMAEDFEKTGRNFSEIVGVLMKLNW